jgi:tetratricopeptide (TPR) repeat protein
MASTARKYGQAKVYLREGLELAYEIGHQEGTAGLLLNLDIVAHNLADYAQATDYCANALAPARQLGHRWLEIDIHCKWGELYFEQEDLGAAAVAFEATLVLGRELGILEYVAIALYGLARVAATHGRNGKAHHQAQESLSLFKTLGHHKAAEVESWLAALE